MSEYRATTTEEPFVGPTAAPLGESPAFMTLDAQYGLTDDDLAIGGTTTHEQTVEQEFQAYITAPLSPSNMDILRFWEVSERTNLLDRQLIMIPDKWACFSHSFRHGDGLPPNSSVGCPM
jgi:hypothetical protein